MKRLLYVSAITALLACGCGGLNDSDHHSGAQLRYRNPQYDFTFSLPASWQGYSVLVQQWEGMSYLPAKDTTAVIARGPIIVLRHPQWQADDPWQDIPIMVYTRSQWEAEAQGKFFPYAGGVMDEMWHNRKYVFAIYSRYNALDSVKGWQEAADIIERNRAANAMPHLHPQ
jgi:hypothetical protein